MSKQPDGGPFFPTQDDSRYWHGASLRDAFAMAALTGLIQGYATAYGSPTKHSDEVVKEAFAYADTALAAREQEGTE